MVVKYSTTPVANTIKVNNLVFGSEPVGYGPTSSTGFWNGIDPPTSGYTIYYYTSGMTMPSIVCPNNDTDAIYWAKVYCEETTNLINSTNFLNWSTINNTILSAITYLSIGQSFTSYNITPTATNGIHRVIKLQGALLSLNTTYNISLSAKANGYNYISFGMTDDSSYQTQTIFNLTNGAVELNSTSTGGVILNSSSTYISDDWYRLNLTITLTSYINNNYFLIFILNSPKNPPQSLNWSGDTVSSVLITQPQIEKNNHTSLYTPNTRTINNINDALFYLRNLVSVAVFNINHPGIVTNGLVLNLDAGLVSSYPKTGTTWYDLSGYGNNGTLTHGPTFNSENMGSLSFAGANDYVSLSYRPQYDIRTGITISIFMKRTTGYNQLQDFHLLSRSPAWFFYDAYNAGYITGSVYIDGVRKGEVTTGIIPMDGHWYYITYTYDSNTHYSSIYINGILKSNLKITGLVNYLIDSSTNNFQNMGQQSLGRGMLISILSLYNRALSPTEITQNFNATKSRFGL